MSVYEESGFRFDFSAAARSAVHDKDAPHDGNTFWPGVDFRVFESEREVWIEVKSWSFKLILDRVERKQAKSDYVQKLMKNEVGKFRDDIVAKFLGTTCYLAWSSLGVPDRVLYLIFLEPPDRGSAPLLGAFQDRLRDEFKNAQARPWGGRIQYQVVALVRFQAIFPQYPVSRQ